MIGDFCFWRGLDKAAVEHDELSESSRLLDDHIWIRRLRLWRGVSVTVARSSRGGVRRRRDSERGAGDRD
jgi:hypothetical protein